MAVSSWFARCSYNAAVSINFRPMTMADLPLMVRWLAQPHIAAVEWGQVHVASLPAATRDFGPAIEGREPTTMMIVQENLRDVGMIQSYRVGDYAEYAHDLAPAGICVDAVRIDYLLGEPDCVGRGLGTAMIRAYVARLLRKYPGAPAVAVGVLQTNPGSWRCLEKAGFTRVWGGAMASDKPGDPPSFVYCYPRGRQ